MVKNISKAFICMVFVQLTAVFCSNAYGTEISCRNSLSGLPNHDSVEQQSQLNYLGNSTLLARIKKSGTPIESIKIVQNIIDEVPDALAYRLFYLNKQIGIVTGVPVAVLKEGTKEIDFDFVESHIFLTDENYYGKGFGSLLYYILARAAHNRGIRVISSNSPSTDALNAWLRLEEKGYAHKIMIRQPLTDVETRFILDIEKIEDFEPGLPTFFNQSMEH